MHQGREQHVHRRGQPGQPGLAHDGAVQEVDLGALAAPQALQGGAEVRHVAHPRPHHPGQRLPQRQRQPGEQAQPGVAESLQCPEPHPAPHSHPHGLAHAGRQHPAEAGMVDDLLHAEAGDGRQRIEHVHDELRPLRPDEVVDHPRGHGLGQHVPPPGGLGVGGAGAAAEVGRRRGGDGHPAGRRVVRGDDRQGAEAFRARQQPGRRGHPVETVLHDDHGGAVENGRVACDGGGRILRLGADQSELRRFDEAFQGRRAGVRLAETSGETDAVCPDGGQPGPARRHRHVMTGPGQQSGEGAAEGARSDYRDLHGPSLGRAVWAERRRNGGYHD